MRGLLRVFGMGAIIVLATGCGHLVYPSDAYQGRVLDAETKEPLAGAVVLAIWYREVSFIPFAAHSPAEDYHDALEVLTDAQGEFTVPAKTHLTTIGKIREPRFIAYYPAYAPFPSLQAWPQGNDVDIAYRHKQFQIRLARLKAREERLDSLPTRPARVPLEKMTNLTRLINVERINLGLSPLSIPAGK